MKKVNKLAEKIVWLVVLVMMARLPMTAAYFSDTETSEGNSFTATSLDIVLTSDTGSFVPEVALTPGDAVSRNFNLANAGGLPVEYDLVYEYVSGDSDFCDALVITPADTLNALLPVLGSHDFNYQVVLPEGTSSTLRNKSCTFNVRANGRQVGLGGSGFVDTEFVQSTITSGTWPPPVPELASPADGTIAIVGSVWTNSPVMDWVDVAWSDPVTYVYQSSHSSAVNPDGSFVVPVYTSGMLGASEIPASGTPDGVYYWHVRACDLVYGCGDWSGAWALMVDSTIQEAGAGDVVINEVMWMGSDGHTADEWIELRNMTGNTIILKNWVIENGGSGSNSIMLSGIIPANGFFLISHYSSTGSVMSDLIVVDNVIAGISLLNDGEQLTLKDAVGNVIDQTPVGVWPSGVNTTLKQSMERNDDPTTGWHTCVDAACNDLIFWDAEGNDYGTPGAANLSENDPSSLPEILSEVLEIPVLMVPTPVVEDLPLVEEEVTEPVVEEVVEEVIVEEAISETI